MAGGIQVGQKGGRKPLDAELNLVPFIDLLSCCISFLLITAVWTQLARINVVQRGQGQAGEKTEEAPPDVKLVVTMDETGYRVSQGGDVTPIPKKDGKAGKEFDYETLSKTLKTLKQSFPDKNDINLESTDDVKYDMIIATMDQCLSAGFPDVSLTDTGAAGL